MAAARSQWIKKAKHMGLSALLGAALAVGIVRAAHHWGFSPHWPADAGDTDFGMRVIYFLFLVCPAFLLMGSWIGWCQAKRKGTGIWMWLGVVAGSALAFWSGQAVAQMPIVMFTPDTANFAVLFFFLFWIFSATLGAAVMKRLSK